MRAVGSVFFGQVNYGYGAMVAPGNLVGMNVWGPFFVCVRKCGISKKKEYARRAERNKIL